MRRLVLHRVGQQQSTVLCPARRHPGCTTQACGIRDRSAEYADAGARVIGVSPDEPAALKKFDSGAQHDHDEEG
ncbi:MAG TPA: redoxin domain-containing protein [Solirubrobacterales bacterium]|nr:redoxin domain-containing protein [Solirubrobacterales bacterium]